MSGRGGGGLQSGAGFGELAEWSNRLERLSQEVEAKEERWMELMERQEAATAAGLK